MSAKLEGAAAPLPPIGAAKANWAAIAASPKFRQLLAAKRRFIIPAMIFFVVYYFVLPVLIGYARPLMERASLGR